MSVLYQVFIIRMLVLTFNQHRLFDSELLYQVWVNIVSICYNIIWSINQVDIQAVWLFIGLLIYNIVLVCILNQLKEAEEDIKILKLNINRITDLFVNRDDYLDDYIKATSADLINIRKDIYKYKNE